MMAGGLSDESSTATIWALRKAIWSIRRILATPSEQEAVV